MIFCTDKSIQDGKFIEAVSFRDTQKARSIPQKRHQTGL